MVKKRHSFDELSDDAQSCNSCGGDRKHMKDIDEAPDKPLWVCPEHYDKYGRGGKMAGLICDVCGEELISKRHGSSCPNGCFAPTKKLKRFLGLE